MISPKTWPKYACFCWPKTTAFSRVIRWADWSSAIFMMRIAQIAAIQRLHNCGAVHRQAVPVHEVFRDKSVWQGKVEVFDLTGHPKANRACTWSHLDGPRDEDERFVSVLELPPVTCATTAVQASIMADLKKGRS